MLLRKQESSQIQAASRRQQTILALSCFKLPDIAQHRDMASIQGSLTEHDGQRDAHSAFALPAQVQLLSSYNHVSPSCAII